MSRSLGNRLHGDAPRDRWLRAGLFRDVGLGLDYLTATVNTAAVARHHGVEVFVNMSQMTV